MQGRIVHGTGNGRGRNVFIHPGNSSMQHVSYARIRLDQAQDQVQFTNAGQETGFICLNGRATVSAAGQSFTMGPDDAVYVSKDMAMDIRTDATCDLVECSAPVTGNYGLQFVCAEDVRRNAKLHFMAGTEGAKREISILLGANVQAGRIVVGITRSKPGNWTSWPPHEHAGMLEEIYVYVDMPAPAFGVQFVYTDAITPAEVEVVREGDAVLLPAGYHPNVAIPGAALNFVWIMSAHREVVDRQWGVVQVDPRFA